jgi:Zn-dependent metalloprotease
MIKKLLLFFFVSLVNLSLAQTTSFGKVPLTKISEAQQKSSIQTILYTEIKPTKGTEFRLVKTIKDKKGIKHYTYQQYYNGIVVEFGVIKVHENNGNKLSYNGAYYNPINLQTSPSISTSQVLANAKRYMGNSNDLYWIHDDGISSSKEATPKLLILPNRSTKELNLVYTIAVGRSKPDSKYGILYVNAVSGEILKFKPLIYKCFELGHQHEEPLLKKDNSLNSINNSSMLVSGTGATVFSGSQTIETTLGGAGYVLYDQTRANTGFSHDVGIATKNGIATVNMNHSNTLNDYNNSGVITEFTDANNNWTAGNMSTDQNQYALDAHWGAQVVFDYWKNKQGRISYDGSGSTIASYVHYKTDYTNAAWISFPGIGRGFMVYGDGEGSYEPLTSLDVIAHEIGHGINLTTSNLDYEWEPGALNEGLSDIWAMVVQDYANNTLGTSKNINLINDENNGGTFRSMSNPKVYNQPDTYGTGGTYWVNVIGCTPNGDSGSSGYNDGCGVHTNSGVLNYWFWLLSEGGSGTNDNGDTYNVNGIGIDAAADIVYQMQQNYLTSTSDYADARTYAIQAALDLFGICSNQVKSTTKAWHAVGVGQPYINTPPIFTSDPLDISVCEFETVVFSAAGSLAINKKWYVNDGSGWNSLTENEFYSGVASDNLTITNPTYEMNGYLYKLYYWNDCGLEISSSGTLTVEENPIATVAVLTDTSCSMSDGAIIINFPDNANRSHIEFSIDGGSTYPYYVSDTLGSLTINGLASATYNVWTRWGNDECPAELGDYTISSVNITSGPSDMSICEFDTVVFSAIGTGAATKKWHVNDGSGWNSISDNEIYSGTNSDNLTISNASFDMNGYLYNLYYYNDCGIEISSSGTLTVWENPIATVTVTDDICSANDGELIINFPENPARSHIEFSIDGGSTYSWHILDTLGSLTIDGLTPATYNVWSRWGNANCPVELGDYTISSVITASIVSTVEAETAQSNGIIMVNFPDDAVQTEIKFSVDGGNTYPYSFDDTLGSEAITGLSANTYNVWVSMGNGACATDLGNVVVSEMAYTNIPDSNFEITLNNLNYDNYLGDNRVPTALINTITDLNISSNSIEDLTGIADFVALKSLQCSDNSLASLDVSSNLDLETLSFGNNTVESLNTTNNTKLINLNFENNLVTNLNLNTNVLLEQIDCRDNRMISLDLSNNLAMTSIWAQNNIITGDLDFSSHTALEIVDFQNNNLIGLNLQNNQNTNITNYNTTGNVNLACVLVDNATYSANTWNDIHWTTSFNDVSCIIKYTQIPDANFEAALEALGYDNISNDGQVPTANISGITNLYLFNENIMNLTGIEDFISLIDLSVDSNELTSLDLSSNTLLVSVSARKNNLISIDVTENTALESLDLYNNSSIINLDLTNNILLETLNCSKNALISLDLTNNVALKSLQCSDNDFVALDVCNNVLLEYLNCNYNENITSLDLTNNFLIKTLYIEMNSIESIDLSNNTLLEYLYCGYTSIMTLDLYNNTVLKELKINDSPYLTYVNIKNGANTIITDFNASYCPNLTCILVDNASYSTNTWTEIDGASSFNEISCDLKIEPKVYLQGAFINPNVGEETLMRDDLRVAGLLPTTSPYSDSLMCDVSVFSITGQDAIVDWVWVELRDTMNNTIVLASQSALLQRDGDLVNIDGISPLVFGITATNYHVVVNHRSHLGVMTFNAFPLTEINTVIDLSSNSGSVIGTTNAVTVMGSTFALIAGDFDGDGQIVNTDVQSVISLAGTSGYSSADADMNGQITNTDIQLLIIRNAGKGQQF